MPSILSKPLTLIAFAMCSLVAFQASGQVKQGSEIGVWGGSAYYFGDINTSGAHLESMREGAGIFYRWNFHKRWALRTGLNYGHLQGADSLSSLPFQQRRNLSFRNRVFDLSSTMEFNFFERKRNRYGQYKYFTPYIYVGIAFVYHQPQAFINDSWVDLRPLGTEGQAVPEFTGRDPYSTVTIAVPIGGGVKYFASKHFAIGLDFGFRKVFSDYIDDVSTTYVDPSVLAANDNGNLAIALADRSVEIDGQQLGRPGSQRGDSARRDAYLYSGITLSYVFAEFWCPSPRN